MAGRGAELDRDARAGWAGAGSPSRCLFGVVAGLAEALAVVGAGLAALGGGDCVVEVPDWGVAPGGATDLVTGGDEPAQRRGEQAAGGVHVGELPGGGVGI